MKKIYKLSMLLFLLPMLWGCKETDIIFDIEQPRFETRPGLELLEVICPYVTASNDQIYIIGEFNGGLDAIGDPRWLLEKAPDTDVSVSKWGIYLDPSDYINGKTLADGYTFYNVAMGEERSLDNTAVLHTEVPGIGQRENVFIYLWQDHFNDKVDPDQVPHTGYTIYVIDNTGYNYLSMFGSTASGQDVFGSWPGLDTTGRIAINGIKLKYFDCGYENDGKTVSLVFNNRGKGEQMQPYEVTLDRDYYLELKSTGVIEEFDPSTYVAHDGYAVFVYNNTEWETPYLYLYGDVDSLNGSWPGRKPTGTQVINGVVYLYYDMGIGNTGLTENLIFSNNGNNQLPDFSGYTINRDLYLELTMAGATEIDPETFNPTPSVPETDNNEEARDPIEGEEVALYVDNHTSWSPMYLYTWKADGGPQILGEWPGKKSDGIKEINGVTYRVYIVPIDNDANYLIFNNGSGGDGNQTESYALIFDQDYYLMVTPSSIINLSSGGDVDDQPSLPQYHLYIENNSNYNPLYVYAWSNDYPELFGGWPGVEATETEVIDGITYLVIPFDAENKTYNLIFSDGNGDEDGKYSGRQYDAGQITTNKDYYIKANVSDAQYIGE